MSSAVVAVLALVAGCGDDDDTGGAATTGPADTVPIADTARPTATTDAVGGPVTIEHAFGSTTVEERPERIVTLGLQWTDVLLALGEQPVAYVADALAGPEGTYPWQEGLLEGSTPIEVASADLPYEEIAGLDPDLILVTYLGAEQDVYDRLSGIAPTIGLLGDRDVDRWQDMIAVGGQLLGEEDEAAAVTAEVEGLAADTAAEHPGLDGKTFALANFVPGDSIYVVADPEDGSSVFFQQLGMQLDPDILAVADGVSGRANISFEQSGLLDADLLVIFSNDADPSDLVGYDQLAVVLAGASAELDYPSVVGLNTPTPLSIPFSLELVRPALEAAAAR